MRIRCGHALRGIHVFFKDAQTCSTVMADGYPDMDLLRMLWLWFIVRLASMFVTTCSLLCFYWNSSFICVDGVLQGRVLFIGKIESFLLVDTSYYLAIPSVIGCSTQILPPLTYQASNSSFINCLSSRTVVSPFFCICSLKSLQIQH